MTPWFKPTQRFYSVKLNKLKLLSFSFFLGIWNGNIDLQLIVSMRKLALYLIKYVSKSEKQTSLLGQLLKIIEKSNDINVKSVIKKTLLQAMSRDISAQEAAFILLHQTLVYSDQTFVFINTSDSVSFLPNGKLSTSDCQVYFQRPSNEESLTMYSFYLKYSRNGKQVSKRVTQKNILVLRPTYKKGSMEFYYQQVN